MASHGARLIWLRLLGFVLAGVVLHFALFYWPLVILDLEAAVFLGTGVIGFVLGALGWFLFARLVDNRFWSVAGIVLVLTILTCVVLIVMQAETAICLVIGLPIYAPFAALGMWVARIWKQRGQSQGRSNAVLIGLPVLAVAVGPQMVWPGADYAVVTKIDIAAPVEVVWAHTLDIAPISAEERIWTLSHGLLGAPRPVSARLQGDLRHLEWTQGVVFQEQITARQEFESLEWDFVFHDPATLAAFDPHVSPDSYHLRLTDGAYRLEAIEGGTRLHLQTRYRLHTPVNAYLGLWGELFLQDFHSAVLDVIKRRSEARV